MANVGSQAQTPRRSYWEVQIFGRVWHFFTSVRLALVLIFLITLAVFIGTMLDQVPPSVRSDATAYDQWLTRAEGRYGVIMTQVFAFFEMFNVFHTLWFRILLGLLTVNIIICTLNRWKWNMADRFPNSDSHDRFLLPARTFQRPLPARPARRQRCRHRQERPAARPVPDLNRSRAGIRRPYADRNRFSRFGTFISHLSLVLILAGTVVGGIWGVSDSEFIVPEGITRDVGLGTDLSVRLEHFTDEYYPEGPPKDFRSDIVILKNGEEVKTGTTRVNSPISYGGLKFHQSFFGQTAVMNVASKEGASLYDGPVPLAWTTREGARPVGSFTLASESLEVWVIGPRSGENDPLVPAGEMRIEV
jgi:cytochrome c biogenesis protein